MHKISSQSYSQACFLFYSNLVRKLTEKTFKKEYIENKLLRGKGWVLDHKLSIKECFEQGVPPNMASHVCNLEMMPEKENLSKGSKSSITFQELLEEINENEYLDE
jgi:hypothetical protein